VSLLRLGFSGFSIKSILKLIRIIRIILKQVIPRQKIDRERNYGRAITEKLENKRDGENIR
jgi:hypothetical protein